MTNYIRQVNEIDFLINNNVKHISIILNDIINIIEVYNMEHRESDIHIDKIHIMIKKLCTVIRDIVTFNSTKIDDLKRSIVEQDKVIDTLVRENCMLSRTVSNYESILESESTCCICYERPNDYINIKCGHKTICEICVNNIDSKCPLCKVTGDYIKVYE